MNGATVAVVITGAIVCVAFVGAISVGVFEKGTRRIVNHDRGPK